ncbi:hypothetical protein O0I10_008331 [Lichtheimia ornata]|uniref:Glycosyltransferase family 32 protein n=1 Tax=Lichtheimia ornata TaxID=688661 RepID=A0AAD7V0E7_9FUNG|nr:uncharacterized protein O0I10_008331 [Lichtheimia ornata]KAJ8655892.1 hypothetical protein O0I10_008331 [Lichtheimia ornata]
MQRIGDLFRIRQSLPYTRLNGNTTAYVRHKCWRPSVVLKWIVLLAPVVVLAFFALFNLQLNIRVYIRNWISHADEAYKKPLNGCFNRLPEDSLYHTGVSEYTYDITPGVALLDGFDCYDFAATIQPTNNTSSSNNKRTIYHAYWRADLSPVGPKQLAVIRSFFATQNPDTAVLYLWSNGDLSTSPIIQDVKKHVGERLQTLIYDPKELSKGTPMENSSHLDFKDGLGYLDGDLIRLMVIYRYGGMWFDMDALLIRDMSPLFEYEWLSQWDCFQPGQFPFNGAFMHFAKESPYLCEMLAEMANGPLPRPGTIDWGGYMYYRVYRRLLYHGIRPWSVIPWCFTDSMVCTPSNSMPGAFDEVEFDEEKLLQTFAYHWHNQWSKTPGSLFRFLENRHKNITGW